MTTLLDGTVLPSFMKVLEGPGPTGSDLSLNDFRIHVGRIVAIHGPGSSTNNNRKFFEYDVEVDVGGGVKKIYPRCVMADPLGGLADYMRWTPRLSHGTDESGAKTDHGTRVLVLCLNGHSGRGVIIGGAKHQALPKETQDDGHHFIAEFNGVKVNVNSAGELILHRKGPTLSDGSPAWDDNEEASISLNELGDIELIAGKDAETMVYLDSNNKKVRMSADNEIYMNAVNNVRIESSGVLTGDATDATLMGETFRAQQQILHNTIMPLLIQLAALIATAGGSTTAAGGALAAVAGVHVIPIVGPIVGSPGVAAAAAALAAAGSSLTAAGPLISQIMAALQTFEAQSLTYLSLKNKSD